MTWKTLFGFIGWFIIRRLVGGEGFVGSSFEGSFMELTVMKFGGTSVANAELIHRKLLKKVQT